MLTRIIPALRMLYSSGGLAAAVFCECKQAIEIAPGGLEPLYISAGDDVKAAFENYHGEKGIAPKIVVVKDIGFVALGCDKENAEFTKRQFLDSAGKAAGPCSTKADKQPKRLTGKIAVITGSAQGFGKGIAESLAAEGAYVVIADINAEGAAQFSAELNQKYGEYCSIPVAVNVTDEASVERMVRETVLAYGGLDIFISNAGVLRAGNIFELTKDNFDFVTSVNYTAFFLCAKYAAAVMKRQHEISPDYLSDIIEINSKSGLEGSNKNFAYAGSKFGGIGLTQSFALEFIEYGIKVNAICPGNYLDGPLWSDPVNGLFKQYLDAGKVKGAKTLADVRKYYEDRVPMKRGCEIADVARAITYVVEQQYETGQAIPVTGGQVMLK